MDGVFARDKSKFGYRDYGSSVMYEPGKILIGGGNPPEPDNFNVRPDSPNSSRDKGCQKKSGGTSPQAAVAGDPFRDAIDLGIQFLLDHGLTWIIHHGNWHSF